jgi:ribosomal-protein-alanine N-acetyltransferase
MTPAFLQASLDGGALRAEAELGAAVPPHWPDIRDILELRLAQICGNPDLQPWLLRAIVLREERIMVGHIGFHDAPGAEHLEPWAPGGVEVGFTVFADWRRRGYAREAVSALMKWAHRHHGVHAFVMTIAPGNHASQALAAGLGFTRVGSHLDAVDGVEDILSLHFV